MKGISQMIIFNATGISIPGKAIDEFIKRARSDSDDSAESGDN